MLYNNALLLCGERSISTLSDATEPRRLLDQVYNTEGIQKCLEHAQWRFATRSAQLDYDPDIDPSFGYARAFPHPSDYRGFVAVCQDEFFREPLLQYNDEAGHLYADLDTIYLRYVSDDNAYGMNINDWPGWFEDYVAAVFAQKICLKLTTGTEARFKVVEAELKSRKLTALNENTRSEPARFPPPGRWTRARHDNRSSRDRGNRSGDLY